MTHFRIFIDSQNYRHWSRNLSPVIRGTRVVHPRRLIRVQEVFKIRVRYIKGSWLRYLMRMRIQSYWKTMMRIYNQYVISICFDLRINKPNNVILNKILPYKPKHHSIRKSNLHMPHEMRIMKTRNILVYAIKNFWVHKTKTLYFKVKSVHPKNHYGHKVQTNWHIHRIKNL